MTGADLGTGKVDRAIETMLDVAEEFASGVSRTCPECGPYDGPRSRPRREQRFAAAVEELVDHGGHLDATVDDGGVFVHVEPPSNRTLTLHDVPSLARIYGMRRTAVHATEGLLMERYDRRESRRAGGAP